MDYDITKIGIEYRLHDGSSFSCMESGYEFGILDLILSRIYEPSRVFRRRYKSIVLTTQVVYTESHELTSYPAHSGSLPTAV